MKYLKNLLPHGLALIDNRVMIASGDVVTLSDKEAEHDDVAFSIRREWAQLSDTPLEKSLKVKEAIVFETPDMVGSEFPPGKEPVVPAPEAVVEVVEEAKPVKAKKAKAVDEVAE